MKTSTRIIDYDFKGCMVGQEKEEPGPPMLISMYALKFMDFIDNILKDYKIKE
jgi:hypothetical protein